MEDKITSRFLAQFEKSRKNIKDWPSWMRETANLATASFPESKRGQAKAKSRHGIKSKTVA